MGYVHVPLGTAVYIYGDRSRESCREVEIFLMYEIKNEKQLRKQAEAEAVQQPAMLCYVN